MHIALLKPAGSFRGLKDCEEGHDLLEFASLTALIALLCLASVGNLAASVHTVFSNISSSLAAAGMNSAGLKSVPDGDETYSAKPAGPREERTASLTAEREEFVVELQQKLDRDSEAEGKINVVQEGDELILTGPSTRELPPEALRSKAAAELGDVSNDRLCSRGFRGVRVRSGPGSEGEYQSLHCDSASR